MVERQDAYAAVIADLKRRRDEIDAMIAQLEAMASGSPALATNIPVGGGDQPTKAPPRIQAHSDFLGMSIADAAKILLGRRRAPMSPADLVAGLEAGGLILSAGNKANVVGSVLNRRQKKVGDVVSPKRGLWALREWYPNRNFGKRAAEPTATDAEEGVLPEEDATETSETEQLFGPPQIVPLRSAE